ncbi:hypothetical protein PF003_g17140 [Phytophthora fragariae]|nr:hypothetical protein PF003_g17140 [Phytophthora fragariae]
MGELRHRPRVQESSALEPIHGRSRLGEGERKETSQVTILLPTALGLLVYQLLEGG